MFLTEASASRSTTMSDDSPGAPAEPEAATGRAYEALLAKIEAKTARVGIIGLGYVGLPLAKAFADNGVAVLGFDVDKTKVERLARGESYIGHIADDVIRSMTLRGSSSKPSNDFARLDEPDAIIICVPTPLTETREPDLSYIVGSAEAIAARLRPGQLVVLESTTYPGTTRDVVLPILERGRPQGRAPTSSSPSAPSAKTRATRTSPPPPSRRSSAASTRRASSSSPIALRSKVVARVVPVSSPEVAEACKILENTYRAVNIALVNELKMLYDRMGIDVWEVIDAAKTKPFGFQAFYPGPGLGGHCIPIDPFYLTWVARKFGMSTRFIELAGEINSSMPEYVVEKRGRGAQRSRTKPVKREQDHPAGYGVQAGRRRPARVARVRADGTPPRPRKARRSSNTATRTSPVLPAMRRHNHHPRISSHGPHPRVPPVARLPRLIVDRPLGRSTGRRSSPHAPLIVDTRNATKGVTRRDNIVTA